MTGHIRKRGKKSWAIALYLGRDQNGKPRYKWHSVKGGKRKAENERNRLLGQLGAGEYVEPSKTTLAEFLKRWLLDYARANVGAKTLERYTEIIDGHLIPSLGNHRLTKLQPLQIQ